MKKLALLAAFLTAASLSTAAMAQNEDMVCLITFGTAAEAEAGADATALSSEYVTLEEALDAVEGDDTVAYWDYSDRYPSNQQEERFCEGPTFNPDQRDDDDDGEEANPNSAKQFAPGQIKEDGESAKGVAPGQVKADGESARDDAPGQQKKNGD